MVLLFKDLFGKFKKRSAAVPIALFAVLLMNSNDCIYGIEPLYTKPSTPSICKILPLGKDQQNIQGSYRNNKDLL